MTTRPPHRHPPAPRARHRVAAMLAGLAALMLAVTLLGAAHHRARGHARPHDAALSSPLAAEGAPAAFDRRDEPPGDPWDGEIGPTQAVLPLHKAVADAAARFAARPIAARLAPAAPGDPDAVQLVYRVRLLTPSGQVIDLRMDAMTGRILDLRGSDLIAARQTGHQK